MDLRSLSKLEELGDLGRAWNALLDPRDPYAVFSRHEWIRSWFDAFGGESTPRVLLASDGAGLQGVLPLRVTCGRFLGQPLRKLDLMANGHSPNADLIAAPARVEPVRQAFAQHLRATASEWDLVTLAELRTGSNLSHAARVLSTEQHMARPQRRAPFLVLETTWEDWQKQTSKSFLKALRSNRKRVERHGAVQVELLERPEELAAGLEEAFAIGARSWQGMDGSAIGATPETRRFYCSIVSWLGGLGGIRLWFLRLAGERVAFELHVVHADVEFGLKTGYDLAFSKLGVGAYLDQRIVQYLLEERRYREYDLLGDADFYKLRWTDRVRDYERIHLFGTSTRGRALAHWHRRLLPVLRRMRDRRAARRASGVASR